MDYEDDLQELLDKAESTMKKAIGEPLEKIKAKRENDVDLEASVGGDMVKAVMDSSDVRLISVEIDDEVMADKELLQDLIVTVVNLLLDKNAERNWHDWCDLQQSVMSRLGLS